MELQLNGSPRGLRANTLKMLARVSEGWERGGGAVPKVLHLAQRADFDRAVEGFLDADVALLGMPLYADAMPALVKRYIEAIAPCQAALAARSARPTLGFLVQSGFPEALHSRPLERYLAKLAQRLGMPYAGTIVRGGCEDLHSQPDRSFEKLWAQLKVLGEQLARNGRFGEAELRAIAGLERFSPIVGFLLSLVLKLPLLDKSWKNQLKKSGAWERRFATPYRSDPV